MELVRCNCPERKARSSTIDAVNRVEDNFVQRDRLRVPISRAFLHADAAVDPPFLEHEGAIADETSGPGPTGTALKGRSIFFDRRDVNRIPGVMVQERKKIRRRTGEGDKKRGVIGRAEADLIEVRDPARVELLRVHDRIKHVGNR